MGAETEATQTEKDRQALEDFVVGNEDLERLEAMLDRFSFFEAIGVVRQESSPLVSSREVPAKRGKTRSPNLALVALSAVRQH
jgi:hypothetical protein